MTSRSCLQCGVDISDKRKGTIFCSRKCQYAPRPIGKFCVKCGDEIICSIRNKSTIKYCGRKCYESNKVNRDLDHSFFSEPNIVNSYYAGFIAADGCVRETGRSQDVFSLKLAEQDEEFLKNFAEALGAKSIYYHDPQASVFPGGREYQCQGLVDLQVCSDQIVSDLGANFGIFPRKTKTLARPPLIDQDHRNAYIAGYVDGDGNYGFRKETMRPTMEICGTEELLLWMKFESGVRQSPKSRGNISRLNLWGDDAVKFRAMYIDMDLPFLARKYRYWEQNRVNLKTTGLYWRKNEIVISE